MPAVIGAKICPKKPGVTGMRTTSRFHFRKTRYEPLPERTEPLPKENAEQLFRRLTASKNPPTNACYVLAAMLERKRVLKQIRTEQTGTGRVLIYEQAATGNVFIVLRSRLAPRPARAGAKRSRAIAPHRRVGSCCSVRLVSV